MSSGASATKSAPASSARRAASWTGHFSVRAGVTVPEGRRTRYELADGRLAHAPGDLLGLILAVDPHAPPRQERARRPFGPGGGGRTSRDSLY